MTWLPGTKNKHGVYRASEVLDLYRKSGGMRAEIKLAQTPEGWRGNRGFNFMTGNWWGSSSPITDRDTLNPTREAAIRQQVDRLHADFANITEPAQQAEAREILRWADSLLSLKQTELFT